MWKRLRAATRKPRDRLVYSHHQAIRHGLRNQPRALTGSATRIENQAMGPAPNDRPQRFESPYRRLMERLRPFACLVPDQQGLETRMNTLLGAAYFA